MLIEATHLSKQYRSGFWGNRTLKAVDDVSFSVERGDVFGVVGESGSGKTTIAKMLLGILPPSAGTICYRQTELTKLGKKKWRELRREIQGVFQHPQMTFNPRRNIYFACAEPIRLYHLAKNKEQEREMIYAMIEQVGISRDQLKKYPP